MEEKTEEVKETQENTSEEWKEPIQKQYTGQQRVVKNSRGVLTVQQEVYIMNPNIKNIDGSNFEYFDWEKVNVQ